jgi:hypothetical protein
VFSPKLEPSVPVTEAAYQLLVLTVFSPKLEPSVPVTEDADQL